METLLKRIEAMDRDVKVIKGTAKNLEAVVTTTVLPSLAFGKPEKKIHPMTEQAFAQLCGLLNIPAEYIQRCGAEIRSANINWWLGHLPESTKWFISMMGNVVRGITKSPTISHTDAGKLLASLYPKIPGAMLSWNKVYNDSSVHARIFCLDLALVPEGTEEEKKTKMAFLGIHFSNNDVVPNSIKVDLLVHREESGSSILLSFNKQRFFRQYPGSDLGRVQLDLETKLLTLPAMVKVVGAQVEKARTKPIKDFAQWAERQRQKYKFNGAVITAAAAIFPKQEQNLWGAVHSIAGAVKDSEEKNRIDIEQMAGLILEAG